MAGKEAASKKVTKRLGLSRKAVQRKPEKDDDDSLAVLDNKEAKSKVTPSQSSSKDDFQTETPKRKSKMEEYDERRDSNWDDDEVFTLISGVKDNWTVITSEHRGVGSKAMTEKAKNEVWEAITQAVNA